MRWLGFLLALLLVVPGLAQAGGSSPLQIRTGDGRQVTFAVELAETPAQQAQGLMNRSSLPADAGMLFDFGVERPVQMWMKNTLIPLDMIFIGSDGRIAGIAERTVPLSLAVIPSPGPIRAVLEVNGGTAERLGLKPGDEVQSPALKKN